MNQQNIEKYKFNKLAPSRQREIASMGGKASQKAAKRRKTLKQLYQWVGEMQVTDKLLKDKLLKMGIAEDDITWQMALVVSTLMSAIKKGDIKTIAFVMNMMEEQKDDKNPFEEFMK